MLDRFKKAPYLRPLLNIGCCFDIPTGIYRKGKHGESILNGGLSYITGIGGRGNNFKSTLAHFMFLTVLNRYLSTQGMLYETELNPLLRDRLNHLAKDMSNISNVDLEELGRFIFTDKTVETGNKWFDSYRDLLKERKKLGDKHFVTTPFVDRAGERVKILNPFITEIDSFSQMNIEAVDAMFDKNEIGDSGANTEALKEAAAKSQMLMQLPGLTGGGNAFIILTAHLDDEHQLDPRAPPAKKLAFLKGKIKFKRVPANFTFLTNNCWYCHGATVLSNDTTKAPEFPRSKEDDLKGDTDLMVVSVQNLRGKNGPSGLPIKLVASQKDGIHVGLTEFYYLKTYDKFGIGGHDRSYYLELVPDIALQRTTVRGKIDSEPKLRRALTFTSEMCQIRQYWHDLDPALKCTPKELYEDIKALGYDWDVLLDTRGFWMFEEDITPTTKPFLSTMDLLRMRLPKEHPEYYKPYWYDKVISNKKEDKK